MKSYLSKFHVHIELENLVLKKCFVNVKLKFGYTEYLIHDINRFIYDLNTCVIRQTPPNVKDALNNFMREASTVKE